MINADRDLIVFKYLEKEKGAATYERYRGFEGYVQADAKAGSTCSLPTRQS